MASGYPGGLKFFYEKIADELRKGDIVYGNLEFPATDKGAFDVSKFWGVGRRMKPEDIQALTYAGFDVVSLANNHLMDYGPEGLLQTIDLLNAERIAHCGAGRSIEEARKPAIVERDGIRVAFVSFTSVFVPSFAATTDRPGMATLRVSTAYLPHQRVLEQPGAPATSLTFSDPKDVKSLLSTIKQSKATADVVVVSTHWGVSQGYRRRVDYQTEVGRACIDAGASLVVGHHPHVLQGVEVYKRGVICYSLGDFVFWNGGPPSKIHDREAILVDADIDKTGLRGVSFHPIVANSDWQPELADEEAGKRIMALIAEDSREFNTVLRMDKGRIVLEL